MEPIEQPVLASLAVYCLLWFIRLFLSLILIHNPQILHMEVPNMSLSGFLWWTIEMIVQIKNILKYWVFG